MCYEDAQEVSNTIKILDLFYVVEIYKASTGSFIRIFYGTTWYSLKNTMPVHVAHKTKKNINRKTACRFLDREMSLHWKEITKSS